MDASHHHSESPLHKAKPKPQSTVKERVSWMSRTSDVVGSHLKTDLDSYLTLIRRKVQERMATTVELITQIRRFKVGDGSHVTPNEFRYTLIKFGIILPQPLVDTIFNVFDSDRSGTMDFDEFAMWIMNSEFQPQVKHKVTSGAATPSTVLRNKLKKIMDDYPAMFRNMKPQVSFIEFVADITRMALPLTEREARSIFQVLDTKDTGFVDSGILINWARTGRIDPSAAARANSKPSTSFEGDVRTIVSEVIGRNTKQLENAFSHVPRGQGIKITFDEFRRCLLNAGCGKNIHSCKVVFNALGGSQHGLADIDLLFKTLDPIWTDPQSEVSAKPSPSPVVSTGRADRALRDAIRKSFKEVKADLEASDPTGSGYVDPDRLYKILVKRCMPLTFQDYRFILQQIRKEPGTSRIDINHFLHGYNPKTQSHQLGGLSTLKNYDSIAATGKTMGAGAGASPAVSPKRAALLQRNSLAASAPSFPTLASASNQSSGNFGNTTGNLSATSYDGRASTATDSVTAARLDKSGALEGSTGQDMKKVWHAVLRECHRADPERTGLISRSAFIAAMNKSSVAKTMDQDAINKMAESYTVSTGAVNYLLFFRSYLDNMVGGVNSTTLSKSSSLKSTSAANLTSGQLAIAKNGLKLKPLHPWDFEYKREKHQDHPYWYQAASMPKDAAKLSSGTLPTIPPPNEKSAADLSATERAQLLSQYNERTIGICSKCYKQFVPIWRTLRNEFKKSQITSQRGSIVTTHFLAILEKHGIALDKQELGVIVKVFRGMGMQDVVKYDEFLRVCLLVKDMN